MLLDHLNSSSRPSANLRSSHFGWSTLNRLYFAESRPRATEQPNYLAILLITGLRTAGARYGPSSRLAQLVERKTLNLVVVGSSPTVGAFSFSALAFQRPEVLFLACYKRACSQTKCYSPLTLTLEGGCPASQIFMRGQLLWRSWQRVGLIIPRSRVRSSPGAHAFLSVCSFLLLLLLTYLLTYLLQKLK